MVCIAGSMTSVCRTRCSSTERSGRTNIPPLNAAIGVVRASGWINICIPRGGRPLVIANWIPAMPNWVTAARARSVSTFSRVRRVPSTSARSSLIGIWKRKKEELRRKSYDGGIKKTVFYFLNSTSELFWLLLFLIVPEKAAVDENSGTGDVIRFIGSQEGNDFRDIGGLPEAF